MPTRLCIHGPTSRLALFFRLHTFHEITRHVSSLVACAHIVFSNRGKQVRKVLPEKLAQLVLRALPGSPVQRASVASLGLW